MTSISTVQGSVARESSERSGTVTAKPSVGDVITAADRSASSGFSNNTSPHSVSTRTKHAFSSGTWECRVQRQCDQLRDLFKLPDTESPVEDFHCALQKKICLQGRLYLFQQHVCFYSNLFGFVKSKVIPLQDVTNVSKRKNVGFPNSIEITWESDGRAKHEFFTSFLHRREAYKMVVTAWANCSLLGEQHMSAQGKGSSAGSSFSGRHGSVASCASLPDETTLPQPDVSSIALPLSRQASEAASSCFDSPESLSSTAGPADIQALASSRTSLRHNRAVSWSPQTTARLNETTGSLVASEEEQHRTIPSFAGHRQGDSGAASSGGQIDEWAAEGGVAPPMPPGTTALLDDVLHVDVHTFCHRFLADRTVFWQEFHESRGDKQISLSSWSRHSALGHIRELRFVSPVKALIGPPQAECFQNQRYRVYRDNHLVLETSQTMPNIPFGDHFTVEVRWDVTQLPGVTSQCRVQSCVSIPFSKATWWKKAIQKGSIDSCREAHQDWLLKVQATLAAPAHVQSPTPSTLASLHSLHPASFPASAQGEVDQLMEQLPKGHREAVARVISIASQGSLCPSSPRSSAGHSEQGLLAYKQSSPGVSRMSKTTRFMDSPGQQQEAPLGQHVPLTAAASGIPTGATAQWWMANRLVPALGSANILLLAVAAIIIGLQVAILMSRIVGSMPVPGTQSSAPLPLPVTDHLSRMGDLHEGLGSVQRRLDSVVQALAANGINI